MKLGRGIVSVLLVGTLFTSVVQGADLAVKAPPPVIMVPVPVASWTGFSVFGFIGWGEISGNTNYVGTDSFSQSILTQANQLLGLPLNYGGNKSGFVGGGGGEYDYQFGSWILGGRADYTYFGQEITNSVTAALRRGQNPPTVTVTNKIGLVGIATIRGVVGYSPPGLSDLLVYANMGPAFAQTSQETIVNTSPAFFGIDQPFDANTWGWAVGGGARYLFNPHWYAQIEGNFYDLTNFSNDNTVLGQINYRKTTSLTATDVTLGIGYKF
jgi:outer membrane immunogenic protein